MKKVLLYLMLLSIGIVQSQTVQPSLPSTLYISKQTGQSTSFKGSVSKTTDKYEHGSLVLQTNGPISITVNPQDLSIGTNQTKTWTGTVKGDAVNGPAPGTSSTATISGNYDTHFSRPYGTGSGGDVEDTYYCAEEGSTGDGCAYHGNNRGKHELIHKIGTENLSFTVYSIQIKIDDIACAATLNSDELTLNATTFPSGGTITWTLPDGSKATGNGIKVKTNGLGAAFNISATFEIEGISTSDQKQVTRNRLIGFKLPPCTDTTKNISDIAILTFDGPCHPFVSFKPPQVSPPMVAWSDDIKVTASCGGDVFDANITTINTNKSISATPLQIDFGAKVGEAIDKVIVAIIADKPLSPCDKSGSLKPSGSIILEESRMCCSDQDPAIKPSTKISGQVTWNYGISCQFPIPALSIPYIASLDLALSAGLSASIGASYQSTCTAGKFCIDAEAKATFGGGIGATVLAGAVKANLQLVVEGIGVKGSVCVYPLPVNGNASVTFGKVKVVGTVTVAWGLSSHSVDYPIFDGFSPINYTF
jgi:hypothetical protein